MEHVARKVLMGKPERKRPLRKICRRGEYNIKKLILKRKRGGGKEWIHLALDKVPWLVVLYIAKLGTPSQAEEL